MTRHLVCAEDEMARGTARVVDGAEPIALFRTATGEYYATADSCTHEEWSLGEDSDLDGNVVECPLHQARFDVTSGAVLCAPALVALRTYPVEIEDGKVYVVEG